jgi:hypothetical protein
MKYVHRDIFLITLFKHEGQNKSKYLCNEIN